MKLHLDTFKLQHLLFLTCIRIILKPAKVEIVHSLLRIPLLRILRDQKLYGSLCNFVHRSLHQKSIMGTPLFTGNAFQWAWFYNELKRKYNVTNVLKLVPDPWNFAADIDRQMTYTVCAFLVFWQHTCMRIKIWICVDTVISTSLIPLSPTVHIFFRTKKKRLSFLVVTWGINIYLNCCWHHCFFSFSAINAYSYI